MDLKKRTEVPQPSDSKAAPQLRVRTSLRGGESLEACQNNLAYWQDQYYKWYEQAKYKTV
jgi:hypothetical protein